MAVWHTGSHKALWGWWAQEREKVDIADHMNYDPYLGRVTENSAAKKE